MDHAAVGLKYAKSVVSGKVIAGKLVIAACQRHLDDLAASREKTYPYKFDKDKANRVCDFIELLPHTKGKWAQARQSLTLEPWQSFALTTVFGWVKKSDNMRRFREAYLEVPRKNGKSALSAGVGLYMFTADGEFGAEVYSGATSEKQAWEVFRPAKIMAERTPEMVEHFDFEVNAKALHKPDDGSRFEPIIGNPGDGSSPSCAIIDEFHEHDTSAMYDTMATGMGSREQPLLWLITTAGTDVGGPCYQRHLDIKKILEGGMTDDRVFGLIYSIDEGDDWKDISVAAKANPNLGVSVSVEYLEMQIAKAVLSPAKQSITQTKHFNVWIGSRNAWVNMVNWSAGRDTTLREEDFLGVPHITGADFATKIDICAVGNLYFREEEDNRFHYYWFPKFFIPEESIDGSRQATKYQGWVSQGALFTHDGQEVNFNELQEMFLEEFEKDPADEFAYDPWRTTQLAQTLRDQGIETVEYRQTIQNMSPAMFELEAAITSGRFHHAGNPVMDWMAANVTAKVDAKGNIYPRKDSQDNKIDGMIALIMAVGRAMHRDTTNMDAAIDSPLRATR